ncbi:MAG TPA: MFS transporter [Bacteroidales bacterium]|nr:MFS transporter [Bacteroidales bacterium]
MTTAEISARDRVPLGQKIAFGTGHLVNNLLPGALGVFMFFLLTAFGMDPFLAGLLGGLPRIFDALTDPIMGYISDNTKSRWGRRKPYIFIGAILTGGLFILLWQLDAANSQTYNFWYFLIVSLIFIIGNTIFSTPLIGLGYEMTSDYKERTRLMAFSQTIGQIAWMIVPWFWVLIANPNLFETQADGVRQLAIIVGAICMVLGILPAFFCKEVNYDQITNQDEITFGKLWGNFKSMLSNMSLIAKNEPFLRLCAATFLVFNGFQLVSSFSYFIMVFYMFQGDYGLAGTWPAWFSTVSALCTALLIIPIVTALANKYGKRNAFIVATLISIVGYALKWWGFNPENPWMIFMPIPFMVFGIGGLFTLMLSMTADVCDLDELRNGMPRKEASFGAVYWWMVKLGMGLAMVLGGLVLKMVGFDQTASIQTAETLTNLRLADILIPATTAALAIWVMWKYDLTEEKANQIKAELIERRGEF